MSLQIQTHTQTHSQTHIHTHTGQRFAQVSTRGCCFCCCRCCCCSLKQLVFCSSAFYSAWALSLEAAAAVVVAHNSLDSILVWTRLSSIELGSFIHLSAHACTTTEARTLAQTTPSTVTTLATATTTTTITTIVTGSFYLQLAYLLFI